MIEIISDTLVAAVVTNFGTNVVKAMWWVQDHRRKPLYTAVAGGLAVVAGGAALMVNLPPDLSSAEKVVAAVLVPAAGFFVSWLQHKLSKATVRR